MGYARGKSLRDAEKKHGVPTGKSSYSGKAGERVNQKPSSKK